MKKRMALLGLGVVAFFATLAFASGWRTYENQIWLGDPNGSGDRNLYFEIGSAPTNPAIRWDNSDAVFKLANDGATFFRIPQQNAALTASEALVTNAGGILTTQAGVSSAEVGYLSDVTSSIQAQLNGKEPTIGLAANVAVITTGGGTLTTGSTTATQLSYLSTTTSDVQTQLDGTVKTTGAQTVAGIKNFTSVLGVNQADPTGRAHITEVTIAAGTINPDDNFDTIVLENNSNAGISIFGVDTSGVIFGRFGSPSVGGVTYNHTGAFSDHMFFKVNGSNRAEIQDDGTFIITVQTDGGSGCPDGGNICSGEYSPTPSGPSTACVSSSGPRFLIDGAWQWMRVGNYVTVHGRATIKCDDAPGPLRIAIPITSNLGNPSDLIGIAIREDGSETEGIEADATNDLFLTSPFPQVENLYLWKFNYVVKP